LISKKKKKKLTHGALRWLGEAATATSSDRELAVDERYTSPQSTPKQITPANTFNMPVKPITGMLRRGLVLDLSVAFGTFSALPNSKRSWKPTWTAKGGAIGCSDMAANALQKANIWSNRSRYRFWLLLVVRYVKSTCALRRDKPLPR
jgi:hypothetical protein